MASEDQFREKASDVAEFFDTTESAVYRLAREGRLPPGTYAYLNGRTLRFSLPTIKRLAAAGELSKPRPRDSEPAAA